MAQRFVLLPQQDGSGFKPPSIWWQFTTSVVSKRFKTEGKHPPVFREKISAIEPSHTTKHLATVGRKKSIFREGHKKRISVSVIKVFFKAMFG